MTYHISIVGLLITLVVNSITAAPSLPNTDTSLDDVYERLLQREYAAPIPFPNHRVERKAQRSPSLRLRFGRSDPSFFVEPMDKRWFGDVNQKPIRSPSLRLRFGKRTDSDVQSIYTREVRKPDLRLRWGRSAPMEEDFENDYQQRRDEELSIGNESLRALLNALLELDDNEMSSREFNREIRKPMRLRWGRSTGMEAIPDQWRLHEPAREQSSSNTENESSSTTAVV